MLPWWVFAIGSAIFVAVNMIIKKKVLQKEHAMQFETIHQSLMFFVMIFLIPYIDFDIPINILGLIILIGAASGIAGIYLAKAYRHMPISQVAPLKNVSPAIVVIIAYFLLGETPAQINIWGIIFLLIGAYVLEANHDLTDIKAPFKKIWTSRYIHYVLLAMLIFGFTAVGIKYVLNFIEPITTLFFVLFFSALATITAIQIFHNGLKEISKGIKLYGRPIFLTAILGVVADLAVLQALTIAYVSLVIPIQRLSTLFATVIGGELFHEKDIWRKAIACGVMVVGAAMVVM